MEILHTTLCVVFMVTLATSKPVSLSEGEDSSKSSESSESKSSEETVALDAPLQEPLQPAFTETDVPDAAGQTDPPTDPPADPGASPSAALPNAEDPQTSTDTLQLIPDDPSQNTLGTGVSQDMPDTDPAVNADNVHVLPDTDVSLHSGLTETDIIVGAGGTSPPQVTTYQGFPQDATPPFLPHISKPASPFSTASPMPIPISTALTGVPVCFTFQFATSEPDPPRGDNI